MKCACNKARVYVLGTMCHNKVYFVCQRPQTSAVMSINTIELEYQNTNY